MIPLKNLLTSRYVIVVGTIVVLILIWNIYVAANNDGIITGRVLDEQGNPVPGATVNLYPAGTAGLLAEPIVKTTDSNGEFIYENHVMIEFTIEVVKDEYETSEKVRYHTFFKSQNFRLPEPIVLQRAESP